MAVLKLHLEEFDEIDYDLIAIHCSLEAYRLAYFINQKLPIILARSKEEIPVVFEEGEVYFSRYIYVNEDSNLSWSLIQNKNSISIPAKQKNVGLFGSNSIEISKKIYLIAEHKKVDYFLKIENNNTGFSSQTIIDHLKKIDHISAAYSLTPETIKSKNNLIF